MVGLRCLPGGRKSSGTTDPVNERMSSRPRHLRMDAEVEASLAWWCIVTSAVSIMHCSSSARALRCCQLMGGSAECTSLAAQVRPFRKTNTRGPSPNSWRIIHVFSKLPCRKKDFFFHSDFIFHTGTLFFFYLNIHLYYVATLTICYPYALKSKLMELMFQCISCIPDANLTLAQAVGLVIHTVLKCTYYNCEC